MALTDADRLHMTHMALARYNVFGKARNPGVFVQDGLALDINPEVDSYTVDENGYITDYTIHGYPNVKERSLRLGDNALWNTSGTNRFTIIDNENIYHYPGSSTTRTLRYTSKTYTDCEITCRIKLSGSGSLFGAIFLRQTDFSTTSYNGYRLAFAGTYFRLSRYVSGTGTELGNKDMTILADTWYKVRFRVVGTEFKAKIWLDGADEPSGWDIEASDDRYSSGRISVYGSNANVYVYFSNLIEHMLYPMTGNARIIQGTELNGKKRIYAETDFKVCYVPFGLPDIMTRTVFMLYRVRDDGLRYNTRFFKETGTSLAFGVVGKDTPGSDNKNVISIFGRAGSTLYPANQFDITISRKDRYELVCAKAVDNTTGIAGYTYGIQEITNRSQQWAEEEWTMLVVNEGMELARLLYYNRVLTDDELVKVHQYLAFTYGESLYLSWDYLRM